MDAQTGKYRDIAELGKGGMGDVFLTVTSGPAGFNKLLVVKRLRAALADDPEFLQMFQSEARLAARLNHPNIVHTYEVGFDGASHYIAMEYLEGQSLQRLIRRAVPSGTLTPEMQLRVLADALGGLHYAHELTDYDGSPLDVVHRDISPANIFVLYNGQVKLVDFGIAKSAGSNETRAGVFKGKIQYVSPEQFVGGPIDRRADIYSAGVVLWEAATQRRMWKDVGDLDIMQRVGAGDVPLPSSVEPRVTKRLEAMCLKALAPRPEDRYPTAAAMQADIEDYLREIGSQVSARDVGQLTALTFADDRVHVRMLIEDQLRLVKDYPDPQSLVPTVMLRQDTMSRMTVPPANLFAAFAPPAPRTRTPWKAVGAGLAATAAVWLVWSSSGDPKARVAPATVPAPSAQSPVLPEPPVTAAAPPAASAPTAGSQVHLSVETFPENARVLVDGALLPANGELAGFSQDHAPHKVRVEARGYRPKTEWVRFDSDNVKVEITLEPITKKGRKDGGAADPGGTSLDATGRELDPNSARRRSGAPAIDTADPWKR